MLAARAKALAALIFVDRIRRHRSARCLTLIGRIGRGQAKRGAGQAAIADLISRVTGVGFAAEDVGVVAIVARAIVAALTMFVELLSSEL